MHQRILGVLVAVFAALLLLAPGVAAAQTPALDPAIAAAAKAQQKQQVEQPLNNKPVWDEVRSGVPLVTTVSGRETNVLIQPEGQTWRALRNSWFSVVAGWALVVLVLIIAAYYLINGTRQLAGKPTGRKVRRFSAWQRSIHWATAITFVILAITGLIILFGKNILLPLIGYTLFSWLSILSKNLHNFVGPLFILCTVLLFFTFVRDNIWRKHDFAWIGSFGGLFSGKDAPSGKFNGGEKLWFWGVSSSAASSLPRAA